MQARMKSPVMILPDALQALRALDKAREEQVPSKAAPHRSESAILFRKIGRAGGGTNRPVR